MTPTQLAQVAAAWTLTLSRLVVPLIFLASGSCPDTSGAWTTLIALVAAGDAVDGRLARAAGLASTAGDLVDATADKVFPASLIACALSWSALVALLAAATVIVVLAELALFYPFVHRWGSGPRSTTLARANASTAFVGGIVVVATGEGLASTLAIASALALGLVRLIELFRIYREEAPPVQSR